ncbi:fimbria major subunit [uncultured Muribaculum sp.]|uniref:fimbria major subunit n=1 Tax=uncultured Muribaculum sp. TaxID=1918613 RepID=UPI0025E77B12|nr:fimbria major subunit [uncultured Muribaculum sp.]
MKFNKFIYASMAAALLAACSDKDVIADGPADGGNQGETMIGDGYVAVRINLPTQVVAAPRAGNDDFDDGIAAEYKVKNGALLLFTGTGTSEATAEFSSAYNLPLDKWVQDDDNDNITASHLTAVKVEVGDLTGKTLYGLVMINYDNVIEETLTAGKKYDAITLKDVDATVFGVGKTFGDLVKLVSTQSFKNADDNFFMTNSPVSKLSQSTATAYADLSDVTTLVVFDANAIQPTEEEAKAKPASSVFVERAVAKATLSAKNASLTIKDQDGKDIPLTPSKVEWALNVTNPASFIVRNMGTGAYLGYNNSDATSIVGKFRMFGNTKIGTTSIQPITDLYRTYWCIDPNYDGTESPKYALDIVDKDNPTGPMTFVAESTPLYCHENTFNVANQANDATTQAMVKVQFGDGNTTYYTVNEAKDVLYTSAEKAQAQSVHYIIYDMGVKQALLDALKAGNIDATIEIDATTYPNYLDIKFTRDATTGIRSVTTLAFKENISVTDKDGNVHTINPVLENAEKLMAAVNEAFVIAEYKDGVSYYPVLFKHFAGSSYTDPADLAPWNPAWVAAANTDKTSESYAAIYNGEPVDPENMWLGRYGMVRNNWYDVNVTAFKKLGAPEIGSIDITNKPDDEKKTEQWIAFKVNILSWAKRVQNIEL